MREINSPLPAGGIFFSLTCAMFTCSVLMIPSFTELHYDLFVEELSSGILCIDVGHHREAGHIFYLKSDSDVFISGSSRGLYVFPRIESVFFLKPNIRDLSFF